MPDVLRDLHRRPGVVQTLVTGNIRAVGIGKAAAFGLDPYLDTAVGGYGDDHPVRSELVVRSRPRAEAAHGRFAGGPGRRRHRPRRRGGAGPPG